jgi:hypothetical protein
MTVRAHFDGRVIVPDEPVSLPVNRPLDVEITPANGGQAGVPARERQRVELPLIRGDGKRIINPTPEELDASLWGN